MRQTSRAVALLLALESTQAAQVADAANANMIYTGANLAGVMIPLGGAANNAAGRLADRTAPYTACAAWL